MCEGAILCNQRCKLDDLLKTRVYFRRPKMKYLITATKKHKFREKLSTGIRQESYLFYPFLTVVEETFERDSYAYIRTLFLIYVFLNHNNSMFVIWLVSAIPTT